MPQRLTIDDCQNYAEERGGDCLEMDFINCNTKMRWRCKYKHEWIVSFGSIRSGNTWCKKCAGLTKPTIEDCQELAKSKKGKCLENEYINRSYPMKWECEFKHQWKTRYDSIKNGKHWCPICAKNVRLTIEECQNYAKKKNGKCHSKIYINNQTKLKWECEFEHIWYAIFSAIKDGHWCPYCYGNAKYTIEDCQNTAIKNNGKCLSKIYEECMALLLWECEFGHQWKACYSNIKNQHQWCPMCSRFKSERLAREIIEIITGVSFNKIRPFWLKYENGKNLELDGYNEDLQIAFEYHGKQHYEEIPHFHRFVNSFKEQEERDIWKEIQCDEMNIDLIIIPYYYDYTNFDKMYDFIESELDKIYEKRRVNEVDSDDDDL